MYFAAATEAGSADTANEDWVAASPTVAVVLDGVSVLDSTVTGCRHGTPWYVNQLGTRLLTAATDTATPLNIALSTAIRQVTALHSDTCDLDQISAPSAAVAVTRLTEQDAQYLVLADTTIVLETATGLNVITDDRVSDTVNDLAGHEGVGTQVMERRERYRNKPGGYWVAAAEPKAADHAITGAVPIRDLHRALLMTDGVTRLVSLFADTDWRGLIDQADKLGAASVIKRVRSIEATDPLGQRWPRFKACDDATIVVLDVRQ
jgi:hypothetical protein